MASDRDRRRLVILARFSPSEAYRVLFLCLSVRSLSSLVVHRTD